MQWSAAKAKNQKQRAMNNSQENKMNMFYATQKCLVENSAVYSAVPALTSAFAEFETNINTLEAATEKQVIDITGFAKDKAEAEDAMILMTLAVAGGVRAYAMVIGDSVLMEKMNVTESRLRKHRDSVVAQHSQAIHGEATLVVASLADYGVTPATLTAFQKAIDRFVTAIAAPRAAITARKGATAEIRELMKDTTKLLVKRLDALVAQFALTAPEFVRAYGNARIIVDTGSSSAPATPVPVAA